MPHIISPTVTQVWKTGGQRYNAKLFDQAFTLKENKKKKTNPKIKQKTKPELLHVYIC